MVSPCPPAAQWAPVFATTVTRGWQGHASATGFADALVGGPSLPRDSYGFCHRQDLTFQRAPGDAVVDNTEEREGLTPRGTWYKDRAPLSASTAVLNAAITSVS
jgi:hypothetical protein